MKFYPISTTISNQKINSDLTKESWNSSKKKANFPDAALLQIKWKGKPFSCITSERINTVSASSNFSISKL